MTASDLPRLVCPNCGHANTTVMASGNAACMDCAHMWNPANEEGPAIAILAPFGMAPVDEIWDAETAAVHNVPIDSEGREIVAPDTSSHPAYVTANLDLASQIGGRVVLEGGQEGFVLAVVDDEHIEVILPDDRTEVVGLADVHAIYDPPAVPPQPADEDDLSALAPDMRLALDMARVIIRAGCESVTGTGETIAPGIPPSGYLIDDPDVFPVVEQAAALAVGMLLELLDADVDAVLRAVGAVSAEPDQGDLTTEVEAHEPGHSEDF